MRIPYTDAIRDRSETLRQRLARAGGMTDIYMASHGLLEAIKNADETAAWRWVDIADTDGYEAYLNDFVDGEDPDDRPDGFEDADIVYLGMSVMHCIIAAQITNDFHPNSGQGVSA